MGALERKYTVQEAAKIVGCGESSVRRRFRDDPKVGRMGKEEGRRKRPYFRLFIPETELKRWWDELTANGR
jgi:hypothetical protein